MAEEVKQVKTTKVQIDDSKLEGVRNANQKLSQIVNSLGSAHIRRKELEDELENLDDRVSELEEDFKSTNAELRNEVSNLEKEYPVGELDLGTGTLTVSEEVGSNEEK